MTHDRSSLRRRPVDLHRGDVRANLVRHQHFMQAAAEQGVQLLVFPELSLTGYERGLAADLAVLPEDALLQPLRDLARELGLTAVVGMPIRLSADAPVLIGALVLGADGSLGVYSKQHLHPGKKSPSPRAMVARC